MTITADALMPSGTALGHYVIRQPLGVGGMGEVYEAEDTRLHRRVALKVVRHDVATDPVRRMRLEREAGAAAMLNHPHIVTVYSLEHAQSTLFIAMELVEGTTLAEGIPNRGFPVDRLLSLSVQLADALHAAHARGIIHRDLKPANVMITREGTVKVLDFGLSKVAVDSDVDVTESLTGDDRLVGTVPYMSPEQLQGQAPDARSDIFSLGIMLFEMATGERPFKSGAPLATLSSILKDPAPFAGDLNAKVPDEISRIIARCLVKEPTQRTQSAADLRNQIEDLERMLESGAWVPVPARSTAGWWRPLRRRIAARSRVWTAVTTVLVLVAVVGVARRAVVANPAASGIDSRVARFTVALPSGQSIVPGFNPDLALSPDGAYLAYTPLPGPVSIRRVDALDSKPITGTDTPGFRGAPLFSPDGRFISFIGGNAIFSSTRPLLKAALSGGAPVKLTDYDMFHRGDWTPDGWIYWTAHYPGGIVRISDSGGPTEPVTQLDVQRGERSHRFANVLPGGRAIIYTVGASGMDSYNDARIDLWDMRDHQRKTLITGATAAVYSPSGHIVYARAGKLLAVPFDLERLEVTGSPFEVIDGVLMSGNTGAASFTISKRGDLAYVPGTAEGGHRTLVWVDRSGREEPLPLPPASYLYPRLSPDGRSLAVETEGPNHDFSVYDFARSVLTKMTTDGLSHDPVWSPDGRRIAYRAWEANGMTMWSMPADRSAMPERLDPAGVRVSPVSFSPDGQFLAFDEKTSDTQDDARVWSLKTNTSVAVATSRFSEGSAKFSPDGKWIAYTSAESGKAEIYVQPFPGPGPKIQISNGGGFDPVWRRSGGELFYRSGNKMMVVTVSTAGTFRASAPQTLWQGNYSSGAGSSCGMPGVASSNYDVSADGQRFLMVRDDDQNDIAKSIVVVLNWATELKARATASRATN